MFEGVGVGLLVTVAWPPQESIEIAPANIRAVISPNERTLPVLRRAAMRTAIASIPINHRRHIGKESTEKPRGRQPSRKCPGRSDEPVVETFSVTGVAVAPSNLIPEGETVQVGVASFVGVTAQVSATVPLKPP